MVFTPDESGNIPYTCWMGMISSNIKVVDEVTKVSGTVVFPEFNGQLDLSNQKEVPALPADKDFIFQCGMNMLHGYEKVVDNINEVDLDKVRKEIQGYKPYGSSLGGSAAGGCCG